MSSHAFRGQIHVPGKNRLLSALAPEEWARLEPHMQRVPMPLGHVLCEPNAPMTHAYFPVQGVVSLVLTSSDGITVEAGIVGNEGLVGTPVLLGAERSTTKAFLQTPGECFRVAAGVVRAEMERAGQLAHIVKRYTHAMVVQVSQSVLCNRVHAVEERLARWILSTHDRVGSDELNLTQEFVAQMLGVRRASVTVAAGALQQAGLICYARGRITVLDRLALEDASCECYAVVRQEYERVLHVPGNGAQLDR